MYLYKCLIQLNPNGTQEEIDTAAVDYHEFEDNYKAGAVEVNAVIIMETTFEVDKTYADFKALLVDPPAWSDVKYKSMKDYCYMLYLLES